MWGKLPYSLWERKVEKMFADYDDILSIEEVAEILKVGMSQAYKIVRTGKLKGYKEGRDWKILKPSLNKYVMEQSGLY